MIIAAALVVAAPRPADRNIGIVAAADGIYGPTQHRDRIRDSF